MVLLGVVAGILHSNIVIHVASLVMFLPSLAIAARRLHDIGKSGWWQLIALIPIIGVIVLIVWLATKGSKEANMYGTSLLVDSDAVQAEPTAEISSVQDGEDKASDAS